MASNFVKITVYPTKIEIWPPCPEVQAAAEPLSVGVVWDNDPGTWEEVRVRSFVRDDESSVETVDFETVFTRGEKNVVKNVKFKFLEINDHYCKYDLVLKRTGSSETFTIDPTLLLRKLG